MKKIHTEAEDRVDDCPVEENNRNQVSELSLVQRLIRSWLDFILDNPLRKSNVKVKIE